MIIYVDRSNVVPGKLAELKSAIVELAAFLEANEPRLLAYNVYFDPDGTQMTVIHVHSDAQSLEWHMKVGGQKFPAFAKYLDMQSIDVYGQPGPTVLAQLRVKAETLGTGLVRVHEHHAGFERAAL